MVMEMLRIMLRNDHTSYFLVLYWGSQGFRIFFSVFYCAGTVSSYIFILMHPTVFPQNPMITDPFLRTADKYWKIVTVGIKRKQQFPHLFSGWQKLIFVVILYSTLI